MIIWLYIYYFSSWDTTMLTNYYYNVSKKSPFSCSFRIRKSEDFGLPTMCLNHKPKNKWVFTVTYSGSACVTLWFDKPCMGTRGTTLDCNTTCWPNVASYQRRACNVCCDGKCLLSRKNSECWGSGLRRYWPVCMFHICSQIWKQEKRHELMHM